MEAALEELKDFIQLIFIKFIKRKIHPHSHAATYSVKLQNPIQYALQITLTFCLSSQISSILSSRFSILLLMTVVAFLSFSSRTISSCILADFQGLGYFHKAVKRRITSFSHPTVNIAIDFQCTTFSIIRDIHCFTLRYNVKLPSKSINFKQANL